SIMIKIQPHMGALRKFTYGKHLISKVEKYVAAKEAGQVYVVDSVSGHSRGSHTPISASSKTSV
ncbi:hypothetical protein IWW49_006736, partial [Coemansia sp. RSA 1797]